MSTKRKPPAEKTGGREDLAQAGGDGHFPAVSEFDPEAVARQQVAEHIGAHRVNHARRNLAVKMHTARVAEAGKAVPLNWYARRVLKEGGGP